MYSEQRKTTHLSKEIADILVEQIKHEWQNELLYKNFAVWCGVRSLFGHEDYFKKRAGEERKHGELIFDYMMDSDYDFEVPALDLQKVDIKGTSPLTLTKMLHERTLDREILTTDMIKKIAAESLKASDYATFSMIQALVTEQVEEELRSHEALDQYELTNDLMLIDERIGELIK